MVSVVSCGADPTGATDATAAFNTAAASNTPLYIPTGTYLISGPVTLTNPGQLVTGDGRGPSIINVPPTFAGAAVFVCNTGEPGPQFRDFSISFQQPNTSPIQYPPAIAAAPRFRMRDMAIYNAWNGVVLPGNCGGSDIIDVEMSAYNVGISIDGSLDSVRIRGLHFWTFAVPSALTSYMSANATAISSGRCDDLHISDCLLLFGWGLKLGQTVNGVTFGRVTGTDFDSCSGINMSAGTFSASNCFFSQDVASRQAILHTGGNLIVGNSHFASSTVVLNNPLIGTSATPGFLTLTGNIFQLPNGQTLTNPIIFAQTGSRIIMSGNRATDCGAGKGNFLSMAQDNWHIITDNAFMGWGLQAPTTLVSALVANNSGVLQA